MKLSFALPLQETRFNSLIRKDFLGKISFMRDLGYDGVELGIREPEKVNINNLERMLESRHLELSAIGTGLMFMEDGLSLTLPNKDLRKRAVNRIKKHIDIARLFNSQVIIGLVRGKKLSPKDADTRYCRNLNDSLRTICDYASCSGTPIAIEPINRYETDFLNCAEEALDFIRAIKYKKLRLLLDTFHMNIEEKDLAKSIVKSKIYLSHFHLADSNRLYPGSGHIDFKEIISTLKEICYTKYLSAEIVSLPDFKTCARRYFKTIKRYL